jgi:hypothetical protein
MEEGEKEGRERGKLLFQCEANPSLEKEQEDSPLSSVRRTPHWKRNKRTVPFPV